MSETMDESVGVVAARHSQEPVELRGPMVRDCIVIGLVITASSAVGAEGQHIAPLDLERAIAYGLSHHPALNADTASDAARQAEVDVARSGYLPELNLSL